MAADLERPAAPRSRHVVLAFPLGESATARLVEAVGPGTELVDIRDADGSEEMVVTPSVSRQLVAKLRAAFPRSRLLVMEVEDDEYDVHFPGPVTTLLDWGADGYYVAGSLEQFAGLLREAEQVDVATPPPSELTPAEQELGDLLDVILRDRVTKRRERR